MPTLDLDNLASLPRFVPELVLSGGILVVLALSFSRVPRSRTSVALVSGLFCVGAMVAAGLTAVPDEVALFGGLLTRDRFADFFKLLIPLAGAVATGLAFSGRDDDELPAETGVTHSSRAVVDRESPEFFALLLAVVLGAQLMAAASNLLMLYLAVELSSLAGYALAGFSRRSRRSSEAALKYVVYGGVASGVMLYGLSLLYGLTGSLDLGKVQHALAAGPGPVALVSVGLCLVGLGFKVAAVPFHSWCPDVYEGAPTAVAALLSVVPKAGGFALLVRVFGFAPSDANAGGSVPWTLLALILAVASMTLGNLAALGQQNLKRLLAYSSIAHAGYLLLGLAAGAPEGHKALLFYLGAYLFANFTAFGVLIAVRADRAASTISPEDPAAVEAVPAWAGLSRRAPFLAFVMAVTLASLAGLPPTAGFIGKYYLFSALIAAGRAHAQPMFFVAALIGVINTVVSLAYYLRVVRAMYLDPAPDAATPSRNAPRLKFLPGLLGGLLFVTVALGLYWSPLDALAGAALPAWAVTP